MPLARGTVIGAYEVRDLLGAGGMGEVYRARDARLGRDVAVKVLPAALAGDPDRLARFEREARLLAAVNHPRIAAVHGVEDSGSGPAIVLELVEGETLAERIARGPLPLADALGIARQIVEALDAAHAHGIVHRDLKPANVKVRPDGAVKVLDFGIAKHLGGDPAAPEAATATMAAGGTRPGSVVGSPAYMSPEQLRGQPADTRADVWGFGCVLYEMLAGRRAFAGGTASEVAAAVLEREPDWRALPAATPPGVRRLLRRCLSKDPHRRLRHIGDAALEIDDALDPGATTRDGESSGSAPPRESPRRRPWPWVAAAMAAAVAVVAMLAAWRADRGAASDPPRVVTLTIAPPPGTSFPQGNGAPWPVVSPDGQQLAFVAIARGGEQRVWIRRLDSSATRPLTGTSGAARPFWSPDSRSIGYFANGQLARVEVESGQTRVLAEAPYLGGLAGTWGDGVIVWKGVGGFYVVPATGGGARLLLPNPEGYNPVVPDFLPDGRRFVFTQLSPRAGETRVCVGAIDGTPPTCVAPTEAPVRYAAPGLLLRVEDGRLAAMPFDADRLQATGPGRVIATDRFRPLGTFAPPPFSASTGDVLAYSVGAGPALLTWLDRTGTPVGPTVGPGLSAALSPDERRLAVARRDPQSDNTDIWLIDRTTGTETRFTFDRDREAEPAFSPDGARLAYVRGGGNDTVRIHAKRLDGSGGDEDLGINGGTPQWAPDGRHLLYQTSDATLNFDVRAMPLDGDRTPVVVAGSEHGERAGRFSPDGRWVAYDSTESGRREIWLQPFPPTGSRWQVSTSGGATPEWRRDGKELFYVAADGALMAVTITLAATPTWGTPQALFATMFAGGAYGEYVVSGDGQRFLLPMPPPLEAATPITVVVNWTALLDP